MDANRYFQEMHNAMAAQNAKAELLLCVRYQDTAGNDAYLELRRSPTDRTTRIYYSTMGRRYLNFQLFRKGWQLCHNAAGEMTGRFPSSAEALIQETDFHAFYRDEAFDPDKTARILQELARHAGTCVDAPASAAAREEATVTVDSFVGGGAHWSYRGTPNADCLPAAAILYWLADVLAGSERRALQSSLPAAQLAARWQTEIELAKQGFAPLRAAAPTPTSRPRSTTRAGQPPRRTPAQNERWQSILAVLSTV